MRWLRNPILRKKNKEGKGEEFTKRFFDFIDMKYVHPALRMEFMEEHGLSEELATQRATMYQVKITKEGLVNAFKVSREIMTSMMLRLGKKFLAIREPSILTQVRSTVKDSPNTWRTNCSSLLSGLTVISSTAREPTATLTHSTSSRLVVYTDSHHGIW